MDCNSLQSASMLSLITVSEAADRLGLFIKNARKAKGYTRAELSAKAGVSVPTLRKLEGTGKTSTDVLLKVLAALGMLDQFMRFLDTHKASAPAFRNIDDVLKKKTADG